MNENEEIQNAFAAAAGEYLAEESRDASRLLPHLEASRENRRAFFRALEADILLNPPGERIAKESSSVTKVTALKSFGFSRIAAVLLLAAGLGVGLHLFLSGRQGAGLRLTTALNDCVLEDGVRARTGELSICDLSPGRNTRIRLGPDGFIETRTTSDARRIELRRGRLYLDVAPGRGRRKISIHAGNVQVNITGTRVMVERREPIVSVLLLKGSVEVRVNGRPWDGNPLRAGSMIRVGGRKPEARSIAPMEMWRLRKAFDSLRRTAANPNRGVEILYDALEQYESSAWRARLRLKDGRVLRGLVKQAGEVYIIAIPGGRIMRVDAANVINLDLVEF